MSDISTVSSVLRSDSSGRKGFYYYMTEIIGVRFKNTGKTYYFSPGEAHVLRREFFDGNRTCRPTSIEPAGWLVDSLVPVERLVEGIPGGIARIGAERDVGREAGEGINVDIASVIG